MRAHDSLYLLKELGKRDKMRGLPTNVINSIEQELGC